MLPTVVAFDILLFVALLILVVTILIAKCSQSVNRMRTWYYLLLSCVNYCVSFLLLLGHQSPSAPEPVLPLCLIQASLIYAAPPMAAAAALFFVIELYLRLSCVLFSRRMSDKLVYWMCWGIPLTHFLIFWMAMILALLDLKTVERQGSGAFCRIDQTAIWLLTGIAVVFYLVIMLGVEVFTIYHLIRQNKAVKDARIRGIDFPLNLFIRTFIFSITAGVGIILTDILISTSTVDTVALYAIVPLSVALVFGSQMSILRPLIFWKRQKPDISMQGKQCATA